MTQKTEMKKRRSLRQSAGFTLLEYCAGAALIAGIVYVAMNTMGDGVNSLATGVSQWSAERVTELENTTNGNNGGGN